MLMPLTDQRIGRDFNLLRINSNLNNHPTVQVKNLQEAIDASEEIGFPLVVRPSYVLGGRAMELVHSPAELEKYLKEAVEVSDQKTNFIRWIFNRCY